MVTRTGGVWRGGTAGGGAGAMRLRPREALRLSCRRPRLGQGSGKKGSFFSLRTQVYLVIYDCVKVSLEHLLLSRYPSQKIMFTFHGWCSGCRVGRFGVVVLVESLVCAVRGLRGCVFSARYGRDVHLKMQVIMF